MYSMKETNLRWIGPIPEEWKLEKVKHCFYLSKEKARDNNPTVLTLARNGVKVRDISNNEGQMAESYYEYNPVKPGDLLLNPMDLYSGDNCNVSHHYGVISPAYANLRSFGYANPEYYNYYFKIQYLIMALFAHGKGVSKDNRWTLNNDTLLNYFIPVPPREEQDQIVRYLDWQISKINKLIHGYQKQIKLLEERRIAFVDSAVTRGVRQYRIMQNIPGNWMGDIPEDWRMIPSKRLFKEGKERKRPEDRPATASQKYGIIAQEDYMRREGKRIVIATQGLDDWKHVEPNDFVISLRSFQGGIERSDIAGCVTWHYIVLLPQKHVVPRYFRWLLKSKSYIKALQGTSEFIRDGQDLRYSNFVKVDLPLISEEEQLEIALFIEEETKKIDNAIPLIQKEIDLLKEYRTRLISDVVTGQMDVRGIEIPEYTPEEDTEDIPDMEDAADEEVTEDE